MAGGTENSLTVAFHSQFIGGAMSEISQNKIIEIERIIEWYRSVILEAVEEEYGTTDGWPGIRRKLLRALGDRGLDGKMKHLLTASISNQTD